MSEHTKASEALVSRIRQLALAQHPPLAMRNLANELNQRLAATSLVWVNPGRGRDPGLLARADRGIAGASGLNRVEFGQQGLFAASPDWPSGPVATDDVGAIRAALGAAGFAGIAGQQYQRALVLKRSLGAGSAGIICLLRPEQAGDSAGLMGILSEISSVFGEVCGNFGIAEGLCEIPLKWNDTHLAGRAIVPGRASGRAFYLNRFADIDHHQPESSEDGAREHECLSNALSRLEAVFSYAAKESDYANEDVGYIYELFLYVLADASFRDELHRLVDSGYTAKSATVMLARRYQESFNQIDDDYLRDRRHDFIYLAHRLIGILDNRDWLCQQSFDASEIVLAGDEIGVADIMMIPAGKLAAIVLHKGSTLAHMAILARAKSIPVVAGISPFHLLRINNQMVVVDADAGELVVEPKKWRLAATGAGGRESPGFRQSAGPAGVVCTADGVPISCFANIGLCEEARAIDRSQVCGVGLFRSEIYFHSQLSFPSVKSQTRYYHRLLSAFHPAPVWMRLLDIGRDKSLQYFTPEYAKRDWCGARMLIDKPEILAAQVKAMLRASANLGNLRILVPNVTQLEEIIKIRAVVEEIHQELRGELPQLVFPELGAMIEVPGLVFLIDHLARYVDYISIGSNDLLRNLLLADREDQTSVDYHTFLSPAILRALATIVVSARAESLRVGICGEAITGAQELMMCLGAGLRQLSVGASSVARARARIAGLEIGECVDLYQRACERETTAEVAELLGRKKGTGALKSA